MTLGTLRQRLHSAKSTMSRMMQSRRVGLASYTTDTRPVCYGKLKVGIQHEILFSQNYIDMEKVIKLMNIKAGDRILTIAANGAHALSKLLANPQEVIALDTDRTALNLAKLQATGIKLLSREEFCSLIGINRRAIPRSERLRIYDRIRRHLEPETQAFWDRSLSYIADGVLYCGLIDRIVEEFSYSVLPKIHEQSTIRDYLALGDDLDEQVAYHENIWNTEKWRMEYMAMRNKSILTLRGPLEIINYGLAYLYQYDRVVRHVPNNRNVFLETLLTGDITGKCKLHAYLTEDNYDIIKDRLDRITWLWADIQEYINDCAIDRKMEYKKFDGINFSTSPLYMFRTPDKLKTMMENAAKICNPGSKLVYYALKEFAITFPNELIGESIIYDGQDDTYCLNYTPTVASVL